MRVAHHRTSQFLSEVHDHCLQALSSDMSSTTLHIVAPSSTFFSTPSSAFFSAPSSAFFSTPSSAFFSAPQVEILMLYDRVWQMQFWKSTRTVCQTEAICITTLFLVPPFSFTHPSLLFPLLSSLPCLCFSCLHSPYTFFSKDPPPTIQPNWRDFRQ